MRADKKPLLNYKNLHKAASIGYLYFLPAFFEK